jgi:O-antigen/teichoic acid export membrane protein
LVFVALARLATPEEVGIYAVLMSVIAVAIAAQDALITKPFTINIAEPGARLAKQSFATISLSGLLGAALCIAGLSTALILSLIGSNQSAAAAIAVPSICCPMFLLREFVRKYLLARLRAGHALLLDVGISTATLGGLAMLYVSGETQATDILWLTAGCGALISIVCVYVQRRDFVADLTAVRSTLRLFWGSGKYFLGGHMALQAQGYLASWIALAMLGKAAAGIYAACAMLAGVSHPLVFGYANILMPKFVRVLNESGSSALRRRVVAETGILASIISVFSTVTIIYAPELLRLLYGWDAYGAHANVLRSLTVASFVGSLGVAPSLALSAAGHARMAAGIMIASAAVNVVLVSSLLPHFGIAGAAYGVLASEIVTAAVRWAAFLKCVPAAQPRSVTQADVMVSRMADGGVIA